jgi:hypothetical protein
VCAPCNSGWLSKLEVQAQPLLIPIIDGNFQGNIPADICYVIALWLFKTALTLHSASIQKKFIPAEHYAMLHQSNSIPRGVVIAIADFKSQQEPYWFQRRGWTAPPDVFADETLDLYFRRTYRITLSFGRLAARIHFWPEDNKPPFRASEYLGDIIRYIHPIGRKGTTWPPVHPVSELQVFDESLVVFRDQPLDLSLQETRL